MNDAFKLPNIQGHKDVFISYRNKDHIVNFVWNLFKEFEEHDIEAWFDKDVLHKNVGEEYTSKIHEGIDHSDFFLLIYTKDIEESDFILNQELQYAINKGKIICCYPYDDIDFNGMKTEITQKLSKLQWLTDPKRSKYIKEYREAYNDEKKRTQLAISINDHKNNEWRYEDMSLFLIRIELQKLLGRPTPYGTYKTLCKTDTTYKASEFQIKVENKALFIPIPESRKKKLIDVKFSLSVENLDEENQEIPNLWSKLSLDTTTLYSQLTDFIKRNYTLEEIYLWIQGKELKRYLKGKTSLSIEDFIGIVSEKVADDFIYKITQEKGTFFNGAMLGVSDVLFDTRTPNVEAHKVCLSMYHSDYFTFKCTVELYHILRSIRDTFEDITKANVKDYAPFFCSLGMGGFIITCQNQNMELMWARRSNLISAPEMWHFSFDETISLKKDAVRDIKENGEKGEIIINADHTINIDVYKLMHRGIEEENGLSVSDLSKEKGIVEVGLIKSDRLEIEILSYALKYLDSESSPVSQMKKYQLLASDSYLEISKYKFENLNQKDCLAGKLLTPEAYYLSKLLHMRYYDRCAFRHGGDKDRGEERKFKIGTNVIIGENSTISDTVVIGNNVKIGKNTVIEDYCFIGDNCTIGNYCKIHRNVFVDDDVVIPDKVKIQNNNSIYNGVILKEGAFVGTNVCFTNDRFPRSINRDGSPVTSKDWTLEYTIVGKGASIGAGAVIRCGLSIGDWAMIGCGSVVTKDVDNEAVVAGNPARPIVYNRIKD